MREFKNSLRRSPGEGSCMLLESSKVCPKEPGGEWAEIEDCCAISGIMHEKQFRKALMKWKQQQWWNIHWVIRHLRRNMIQEQQQLGRKVCGRLKKKKNVIHDIVQIYHNLRCHCLCRCCGGLADDGRRASAKREIASSEKMLNYSMVDIMDCYVCTTLELMCGARAEVRERESHWHSILNRTIDLISLVLLLEWDNKLWNLK